MSSTVNSKQSTPSVALMQRMSQVMLTDQRRFVGRIKKLESATEPKILGLEKEIAASEQRAVRRRERFQEVAVAIDLPIAEKAQEIVDSIKANSVTIVAGATGSGKTTQLPKLCLQAGYGVYGCIGHTQPRRIAARATASRIASELSCEIGEGVGYKVRFSDHTGTDCQVKLLTDGMLLQEAHHDRQLMEYDCLIIDEAHERSLNIDFLMGLVKRLLKKRPKLRVIITSATINPKEFSEFFDEAPVIEVSGRSYPINIEYHPAQDTPINQHVSTVIDDLWRNHGRADVLVFLPGEREIHETLKLLSGRLGNDVEVLPLYARLPIKQQGRIFNASKTTRVILATNVAETSLTVPGIVFVVDSGTARISRYNYKSKLQRLLVEDISQASASQRAGRCGRTQAGVCARLYCEDDFDQREPFTDPEIVRTNLASVILKMSVLDLGRISKFDFINRPDRRFIKDGYRLLEQLEAVDENHQVTQLGRLIARYPLDPRLGKVLASSIEDGCLDEVQIIAAGLSAGDSRERPVGHAAAADVKHKIFLDETSDFISLLNIWQAWRSCKGTMKQKRQWCKEHYLSVRRLQEWQDVLLQLTYLAKDQGHTVNVRKATRSQLHTTLLRGFIDNIGQRKTPHVYTGARNRDFKLFPGSGVAAKPPQWVMAAEIVQTSQIFARQVAQIQPAWIEVAAAHLTRKHCVEELWNKQRGCPMGIEEVTLFGFVLNRSRRVHLAKHDPVSARRLFIQQALVDNRWLYSAPFIDLNQNARRKIEGYEAKLRRVLLDEQKQFALFDQRLPDTIVDKKTFHAWWQKKSKENDNFLLLQPEDLGEATEPRSVWYPDSMKIGGHEASLSYLFDPSNVRDGVTLNVPAPLLGTLKSEQVEWLIPAWLKSKVEFYFKALPKSQRKLLVPIADCAQQFMVWAIDQQLPGGTESLRCAMSRFVGQHRGVEVAFEDWSAKQLPDWLQLGVAVIDAEGLECGWDRKLDVIKAASTGTTALAALISDNEWIRTDISQWDFGDLPDTVPVEHGDVQVNASPVLVDKNFRVDLELVPTMADVPVLHQGGVLRLLARNLKDKQKYLRKNLPDLNRLSVLYLHLGEFDHLFDDLMLTSIRQLVPQSATIRTSAEFSKALAHCRDKIIATVQTLSSEVLLVLTLRQDLLMKLEAVQSQLDANAVSDIRQQLSGLVNEGFVRNTPLRWLAEVPRYLSAIETRIEKFAQNGTESKVALQVAEHAARWRQMDAQTKIQKADYRWLIEEWRVSVFAQKLGTQMPISAKRIEKYLSASSTTSTSGSSA